MLFWVCLYVFTATQNVQAVEEGRSKLVQIAQGPVRGYEHPDGGFFVFYNIPYAKAPTGRHKFKAPLPPPVWNETLEAVNKGIICPQTAYKFDIMPTVKQVQEDCLVANIYVPDNIESNLPVVVYVHGGAFILGFGELISPKELVKSKKVISVTFNYRLGAHGFLCLGSEDVPGNAGMKDQVALLRWVNKNIAEFGGNPQDVTIAGYSAGSSSVDLLMISKAARGLFHKVIPESGANTAAFSIQTDPLRNAKMYAKMLNYTNTDDFFALEEFYKTTSFDFLTSINLMSLTDSTFIFSPCIERDTGGEIFLSSNPVNILMQQDYMKVPVLYGFANMEGILRIDQFESWKNRMNENFADFLPPDLNYKNDKEKKELAQEIKHFYFGDKPVSEENILEYVNFFSDVIFAYPTLRSVKLYVEGGHDQIYLYEYSYTDKNTPVVPHTNERGAHHCEQTNTILGGLVNNNKTEETEDFMKHKKLMRTLWLNFIVTGKPVPEGSDLPSWPPVGANWSPHMSLGKTMELRGSLLLKRASFWDRIFEKHYRVPVPPPLPPATHSEL